LSVQARAVNGAQLVECMVAGEQASRLYVRDLRMRVGGAVLRCGGIADVETQEHYRRRGYARQVLERAVALMRKQGCDISVLFGISDFYPRWGYAPVFPESRLAMAVKDAARARPAYRLRRLGRHELGATLELYQRNNARRTGAIVRRRDRWAGFRHGSRYRWPTNVYGAFDGRGRLMGYAVLDKSPAEAIVCEIGYRGQEAFGTLLAAAVRQARRAQAEHIQILAPPDHPVVEFCQQLGYRCAGCAPLDHPPPPQRRRHGAHHQPAGLFRPAGARADAEAHLPPPRPVRRLRLARPADHRERHRRSRAARPVRRLRSARTRSYARRPGAPPMLRCASRRRC